VNRDEFTALPPSLALGLLWDVLERNHIVSGLQSTEAPKPARSPKYDQAIFRKNGITFASEYDLEGLRFWHAQKQQGAESGGQYADKDAKSAKALSYWIAWREQNPGAVWSGERNRQQVTAKPPQAKPEVYPRDGARGAAPSEATTQYSDSDYGSDDNDDLPF
jgi:hypothetical protein